MQLELLSLLSTSEAYTKYVPYLKGYTLTNEVAQLVKDIGIYYTFKPEVESIDWDAFKGWFQLVQHPSMKREQMEAYVTVMDNLQTYTPDPAIMSQVIDLDYIAQIKSLTTDYILEGKKKEDTFDSISCILEERGVNKNKLQGKTDFVDMDIDRLVQSVVKGHGVEWRLDLLNECVGQVHHSDFIVVCKRPETGGTSFLISEFTYMLHQLPPGKDAIIFNNEEGGDKLALRIVQSALNITTQELMADLPRYKAEFTKFLGDRHIRLVHKPGISVREIERICKQGDYFLIGINVIEKLKGIEGGHKGGVDDVARRQHIAEWCRGLADKHGAVIGIVQAGDLAEGVDYMTQNMMYGSKTGVQGEIDVLIMIGRVHDPSQDGTRFMSICKNKKPCTGRMDPTKSHARFPCNFDRQTGHYT